MSIDYYISARTIQVVDSDRNTYSVAQDHPNFFKIHEALVKKEPEDKILDLINLTRAIERRVEEAVAGNYLPHGKVRIEYGQVYYDGLVVETILTHKMLGALAEGHDLRPWILFMENLYLNPNHSTRLELYEWMQECNLPLTTDGHFLAYKKVRENYKDCHTGTMDNSIGKVVALASREKVDPNRNNHCSQGLHFCSKSYLPHFYGGSGHVMVLKINPADVVSIPTDYNFAKGRCWRYEVIGEIREDSVQEKEWPVISDWTAPRYD